MGPHSLQCENQFLKEFQKYFKKSSVITLKYVQIKKSQYSKKEKPHSYQQYKQKSITRKNYPTNITHQHVAIHKIKEEDTQCQQEEAGGGRKFGDGQPE